METSVNEIDLLDRSLDKHRALIEPLEVITFTCCSMEQQTMLIHGAHARRWGNCRAPPDQTPSSYRHQGSNGVSYKFIVLTQSRRNIERNL
jgi:hypothetical protein